MITTFEETGLKPAIIRAITELGFVAPMPVQAQVIPILLNGKQDLVGLAQTGTGKTAAFGLPIINDIEVTDKRTRAIILCPTRELCIQIAADLNDFSKHIPELTILPVYGGASIEQQIKVLKRGVQIIVATPGRMLDLMKRKEVNITGVHTVVLDEADEMLNMGFRDELNGILAETPTEKRVLLFSATMPPEVSSIAKGYMNNPIEVVIGNRNSSAENVRHLYYLVNARDRYLALKRIADVNPNIYGIIFCRTRQETRDVAEKLIKDGYNADALHGDLSQAQRDQVMQRFRIKNIQMLVATDVAARGLDVDDLTHVINYNLPDEGEIYTHRSGRTGRAGKSGISIIIVHTRETGKIKEIEKIIRKKFERIQVPGGREICEKQLFHFIDKMENVAVDHTQIEPFLPQVYKKLEWLSREDIIKQFVSLEFNRFLEYYKNAPDLNVYDNKEYRENKSDDRKDRRFERSDERRNGRSNGRNEGRRENRPSRGNDSDDFTRFFINYGSKDGIQPAGLIGMLNDYTRTREMRIGKIDIKDKFAFFEVESSYAKNVVSSFNNVEIDGRRVVVEEAQPKKNSDESFEFRKEKKSSRPNGGFKERERSNKPKTGKWQSNRR